MHKFWQDLNIAKVDWWNGSIIANILATQQLLMERFRHLENIILPNLAVGHLCHSLTSFWVKPSEYDLYVEKNWLIFQTWLSDYNWAVYPLSLDFILCRYCTVYLLDTSSSEQHCTTALFCVHSINLTEELSERNKKRMQRQQRKKQKRKTIQTLIK